MDILTPRSHLFTVRVWEEEIGTNQTEWRGKVQLFPGGEVRYFREWATLTPLLLAMLSESEMEQTTAMKDRKTKDWQQESKGIGNE